MPAAIPVNRLEVGDHACVTFSDAEERLDILAAFVSAGLECGDMVICFTDAAGIEDDLRDRNVVVAERQLCVVPTKQFWGDDAGPDAVAMVKRLAGEMARAQSEGRRGLRITADMCWAARPQANAEQLLAFESEVGKLFAQETDARLGAQVSQDLGADGFRHPELQPRFPVGIGSRT